MEGTRSFVTLLLRTAIRRGSPLVDGHSENSCSMQDNMLEKKNEMAASGEW
jgi:hypothetical protein